ncbi:hypothetical protein EXS66_02780, partial [Candidatus Saccharibacteria bacterium]|nr:hypothetical protein [Candidatus Saccharibacteria bacterium]
MTEDYPKPTNENNPTEPTHRELLDAPETDTALHLAFGATAVRPNLVENRAVAHEALFKGELPYEAPPDEVDIGLASLWRAYTSKRGTRGDTVNNHFVEAPKIVEKILSDHERLSRSPEGSNGAAIFSFLSPETQALVSEITTGAIKNW